MKGRNSLRAYGLFPSLYNHNDRKDLRPASLLCLEP